ncbi:hypothetical protein GCM10010524_29830 [Streptomyces mexicanus]
MCAAREAKLRDASLRVVHALRWPAPRTDVDRVISQPMRTLSADLTGQANHLGATIEADIVKQKQPENNDGYPALGFGRTDKRLYAGSPPTILTRWQGPVARWDGPGSSTAAALRPGKVT